MTYISSAILQLLVTGPVHWLLPGKASILIRSEQASDDETYNNKKNIGDIYRESGSP